MYERLLFHTAKKNPSSVLYPKTNSHIIQRKRSSSIKKYSGLVLKTLGQENSGQIPISLSSRTQLTDHPIRAGLMQKNGSYLSPLYLVNSNSHFRFSMPFKQENTRFMKRNFTGKAMLACLVIAPANQVYSGFYLGMSRKEI